MANNLTADWLNFRANSCAAGNGRNVLKKCHACRHAQRQFQGLKSTTVINQACWPRTFNARFLRVSVLRLCLLITDSLDNL